MRSDVDEPARSTHELEELTPATGIAMVFLDRELRIQRCTPSAMALLRFNSADLGHSLADLAHPLAYPEFVADAQRSLALLQPTQRDVAAGERWYTARTLPYRTTSDPIAGVVLTFVDITDRKRSETELARLVAESERQLQIYETALNSTPDLAGVFGLDYRVVYATESFKNIWGQDPQEATGKTLRELGHEPGHAAMHESQIDQVRATRRPIRGQLPFTGTNGRAPHECIFVPVIGPDGEVEAVALTMCHVTERQEAVARLLASEERQAFTMHLVDALRPLIDPVEVQSAASRMLGEFLKANRVVYYEIRDEEYVIERDYTAGVQPLAGRYPVASFGTALLAELLAGRTVIETDATTKHDRSPVEQAAFAAIQVRGHVDVPLVKGGRLVAGMTIHCADPRDWTQDEVQLIEDTAERTWAAVERARAETAFRTSEERFRTLFESMDEGFCVVELAFDEEGRARDYRIIEMNSAFEKHTGMSGLIGRSVREALPDLEEFWYETYGRVAATGEPTRFVHVAAPMNGRCFDVYAFRLGPDGSNKVAILFNDITASRRAEETIRASEARNSFLVMLTDALRPLSDPIDVQVEASRILGERLGANRVAYFEIRGDDYVIERDYAAAAASVVGRYPVASFGVAILAAFRSGRTTTQANVHALAWLTAEEKRAFASVDVASYITVPLVKDGVFVAGLTVHSARPRAWTPTELAICEDTAERTWAAVERVRAEAALRASEVGRRLALEAADLGTWHVDPLTRLTKTDERYRAIFGITEEWTDYLQLFAVIHPEDRPAVERAAAAGTNPDNPVPSTIEYRVVHPDGTVRWVLGKGRLIHEGEGETKVASFSGTVMDITEKKLIEEERERLVAQLRDTDRQKDEFLATLAHELRNPLAPIHNGLHLMKLGRSDTEALEKTRAMMERQVQQMTHLIDDLMDVTRINQGKIVLKKTRINLADAVRNAVDICRPLIDARGHALIVTLPPEPVYVDGDLTRLSQMFANLLNNAAKYTDADGRIRLVVEQLETEAILSVEDNGVGIAAENLTRVFDMFSQIDRSLEKSQGGLGIGLHIVRRLVELHDGRISVESGGHGAGSRFVVRLPVALPIGTKNPHDRQGVLNDTPARRRILIVDDNRDVAASLADILTIMGNDTRTAFDGEQACIVTEAFRPDVLVMDIGMPKVNGYEACRRIRGEPWGQNIVIIAQSGWGQEDDRRKSQEAGFTAHMVKPLDLPALAELLAGLPATIG